MISFALKPVLSSVPSDALRDSKLSRNRTDIAAITEDAKERPEREPEHAGGLPTCCSSENPASRGRNCVAKFLELLHVVKLTPQGFHQ